MNSNKRQSNGLYLVAGLIILALFCLLSAQCNTVNDEVFLTISSRKLISNDTWSGRPHLIQDENTWIMIYRDASRHTADPGALFHIRFSKDEGKTWTPDDIFIDGSKVSGFPIQGRDETESIADGILIKAPNDDLLLHVMSADTNNVMRGTRQWRSLDHGRSWIAEGQVNNDDTLIGGQDYFVNGSTIYISAWIDPGADIRPPYRSSLYKSVDNGNTWTLVSHITNTLDNTDEPGIAYLGNSTILAVLRDTNENTTFQRKSMDMGITWAPIEDKTPQLGVVQRPRLHDNNERLYLIGRQREKLQKTVIYYSDDAGDSWSTPSFVDNTDYIDCGYCEILQKSNGEFYMLSYAGNRTTADVMEYIFSWSL